MSALRDPTNWVARAQLETARAWGVPLSSIRRGSEGNDWSRPSDRVAAVALTVLERTTHTCGQDAELAFDDELAEQWAVDDEIVCHACVALDKWADSRPEQGAIGRAYLRDPLTPEQQATRDDLLARYGSAQSSD